MKVNKVVILAITLLTVFYCKEEINVSNESGYKLSKSDSIKVERLKRKAYRQNLFSQEYQKYLDSALQIDPSNAYLWQQKAMPCFKSKKYEIGMEFIDRAVALNPKEYLDYRAYIKCIFSKQYRACIRDFEKVKELHGDSYVMDHSYDFFLGLAHLQLNEFRKANNYFRASIDRELTQHGEGWVHHLDWFYLGISEFELHNYSEAIEAFDKSLKEYAVFADAQYYKGKCLIRLGDIKEAKAVLQLGYENIKLGNTINDTNSKYEVYPYQIFIEQFENFKD